MSEERHVVFYDGMCGLCDYLVQWLLERDTKEVFLFAPLQGKTAERKLSHLSEAVKRADSMVLIENYDQPHEKVYLFGKAALRVLWLLGGSWKAIGWMNFIPQDFYDWIYWIVARNRHKIFGKIEIPKERGEGRFLP